jgi:hypothetical protein
VRLSVQASRINVWPRFFLIGCPLPRRCENEKRQVPVSVIMAHTGEGTTKKSAVFIANDNREWKAKPEPELRRTWRANRDAYYPNRGRKNPVCFLCSSKAAPKCSVKIASSRFAL